jgi:CRISPR-associated protein Csm4
MKIIYLEPKSTFRTDLRSDTLWGMICWAIRNIYGNSDLENFMQSHINNKPEFIISSPFPYTTIENKRTIFFPRPIIPEKYLDKSIINRKEKIEKAQQRKDIKKIQFLDYNNYINIISGVKRLSEVLNNIVNRNDVSKSPVLKSESITHNTVDRLKGGSLILKDGGQLFHVDEFYFDIKVDENEKAGLFFLVKGNTDKLEGALRYLEHIGIGGDRNIGKGYFEIKIEDFDFEEPEEYNAVTNLSLYYPTKEELATFEGNELFNYQLEERQGYMSFLKHKNFDKPATMMFKEGSVFPVIDNDVYGINPIVKNKSESQPYNVYQYGIGFMIKMKID